MHIQLILWTVFFAISDGLICAIFGRSTLLIHPISSSIMCLVTISVWEKDFRFPPITRINVSVDFSVGIRSQHNAPGTVGV
jgi:hypothetical protein